jgi:hypothetical protein
MQWAGEIKGRARVDIADWSRSNITLEKHDVRICDARPIREHLSLDREGFTLAEDGNRLASDCDLEAEGAGYLSAVAETVKALSGADFVLPQGKGMLKRHAERAKIDGAIPPSRWAHMDYTGYAARKWVEWIEGWEGRELRHYPRFAIYQTWRVLSPPPQDNTLVLCDASTIDPDDQIVFDAAIREPFDEPGNQFESQLCRYRPEQSWYYFPDMTADELIVWKGFDSDPVKDAQPLHNSADIPGLPDTAPRCSVEARFFAFFDSPH